MNLSIGTPTADSYVSVSYANTYFTERIISDNWSNILTNSTGTLTATSKKEALLKQATREIDQNLRFCENKYSWGMFGASDYQKLQFPRRSNMDATGALYIPIEVKDATCEQALWIMERGGKRMDEKGQVIERQTISNETSNIIRHWIERMVQPIGQYR